MKDKQFHCVFSFECMLDYMQWHIVYHVEFVV